MPTPESRWATRGISVSRSSRRAWLPISPQYRFTNCQPEIPTAASSEPPVAPWPPGALGALVLYHRPANIDYSAGNLTRRIWGAAASGTLQAPDDTHARAEPVLGTHPALPACLARRLSHVCVPCSALARRLVPASVIAVGGGMGSGPNIRGSKRPEAAPTGTTLSGSLRAFLLTRLLGRPLSGTTGGADTSAGSKSELLGQHSGDHDNTQWECRQRFDSLGRTSAGMHEPDSSSHIRPSLALSRSSPGGYRNGPRSHLEEHTAGASSPSGQFPQALLPNSEGRPIVGDTRVL